MDAPELNFHTRADDAECGAEYARDSLAARLPPGRILVTLRGLPGEPVKDRYGRTLANAYLTHVMPASAEPNTSFWLVEQGLARVYREYPTVETDEAIRLETRARERGLGVWGMCPGG